MRLSRWPRDCRANKPRALVNGFNTNQRGTCMQTTRFALPAQPGWIGEFRAFIARGNVVDLAIGIIIGAAFTGVVNSVVKDIINPVIGLAIGGVDFSNIFIALDRQNYSSLDAAQKAGAPTLNIGLFINALINFVIIALVVFWIGKAAARLIRREAESPSAPP